MRAVVVSVLLGLLAAVAMAPVASAARADSASLRMTSELGDYIGGGIDYDYDTSRNDVFNSSSTGRTVHVDLQAANADWWHLDFASPEGQTLAVGTYGSATRYPFQSPGAPGLSVYGNGSGCNTLTGSSTVNEISFGLFGYLERFDADFVQHCEGGEPALRGHLRIVNPPAPPPLSIAIDPAASGYADRATGNATVHGKITCSVPTTVSMSGTLTQRANRLVTSSGRFERQIECSGTTMWQATVRSDNGVPFNPGSAGLDVTAQAYDTSYDRSVHESKSQTVKLTR
jgi:hypothetical protein